jgi:hypothetical protein
LSVPCLVLLYVMFLFYCLPCFRSIVCPVSAILSVFFLFYFLSCFWSIVCPISVLLSVLFLFSCLSCQYNRNRTDIITETGQTIEQK